jgi:MFS family permease
MSERGGTGTAARVAVAVAAGLALADASIVTLGLPSILVELGTSVEAVALVLGVYTLVLAVALPVAVVLARRHSAAALGSAGLVLFGVSSLACGLVNDIEPLLVLRGVQAVGGAAALVAAFDLLDGGTPGPGRRMWVAASVFGTATGPALGGLLTELFDWRAIFLAQLPIVLPGAIACLVAWRGSGPMSTASGQSEAGPFSRMPLRPLIALALLSAALTAVVFLVVLLLVAGWSVEPLVAALAVSILPASAYLASRVGGDPETRAAAGCLLVAGGIGCLALLPDASPWWTVAPQMLAGAGMGLAFPALSGELMPERTRRDAATLLSVRHIGIAVTVAVLGLVVGSSLDNTISEAREEGTAVLLDARLDPLTKIEVGPRIFDGIEEDDPRGELERSMAEAREGLDGDDLDELDSVAGQLDDIVTGAVRSSFRIAFIVTGALALAAGLLLLAGALGPGRGIAGVPLAAAAAVALAVMAGYGVVFAGSERERVKIEDPCSADRDSPDTGGITGALQDFSLDAMDDAACEAGSSREELALALVNDELAEEYEKEYGEDPRSLSFLGGGLLDQILD